MDVDRRIAAALPVTDGAVARLDLGGADDELLDAIVAGHAVPAGVIVLRPSRRASRRVATAAVAGITVLALTAAGVATLRAHTGIFGRGAHTEEGTGELIRLDASDAAHIVDGIGADIPLPPGATFDRWKANALTDAAHGGGGAMSESGIESSLSLDAACQWTAYWLTAYGDHDAAGTARAQRVLDAIPTWLAIASADADGLVRAALTIRATGARASDPSIFMSEYLTNCPSP